MKRNWQPEELIENWTLIPAELDLLTKKTATNCLGIALLLKYFQYEGRFPTSKAEIPRDVICYVAQLIKVSPDRFDNYDWQGRTIKAHRALIRNFLGITEATVKDAEDLTAWLETQVLAYELKLESLELAARERLRHLKIEPPTPERLERIVRSAIRRFEDNFCEKSAEKLSSSVRTKLDELLETKDDGNVKINRINYELAVLQALRDGLRCKEIWVVGANRYRNPEEDLPTDFEQQREVYYQALQQPEDVEAFISNLQQQMTDGLAQLDRGIPKNKPVKILTKHNGWIKLSPFAALPKPLNLKRLKTEIEQRWSMTSLLDMLKETDLRVNFTQHFKSVSSRENLKPKVLQKRLLIDLYGLETNTGIKRLSLG